MQRPCTALTLAGAAAVHLAFVATALAQTVPWPRCSERLDGQALCSQGSVCECHYDGGGSLTGRVAGWRWSCDLLRMCGEPMPAGPDPQSLPPGFSMSTNPPDTPTQDQLPPPRRPRFLQPR